MRSPIMRGRGSCLRSTAFRAEVIRGTKLTLYLFIKPLYLLFIQLEK
jgi:hypothetical protein